MSIARYIPVRLTGNIACGLELEIIPIVILLIVFVLPVSNASNNHLGGLLEMVVNLRGGEKRAVVFGLGLHFTPSMERNFTQTKYASMQ